MKTDDVIVRMAKENEVLEIAKVKQKCWETTYRGIYEDELIDNFDVPKAADTFKKIILDEDSDLYVTIVDEKVIGFMSFGRMYQPYKDYEQELGMLYILEEYRGQGIGSMMFLIAKDGIKRKGYEEFIVSVNKYNEKARKFYDKMGGRKLEVIDDQDKRKAKVKYLFEVGD